MHLQRLAADEAAVRRFIEELWCPFNRYLEATVEDFALALDVDVDNERAVAFYEKLGFETHRRRMAAPVDEF